MDKISVVGVCEYVVKSPPLNQKWLSKGRHVVIRRVKFLGDGCPTGIEYDSESVKMGKGDFV